MIKTLLIKDILAATASSRDLGSLLRLEVLSAMGSYQTTIRPALGRGNVSINNSTAASLAHLAHLLGLSPTSPPQLQRHLVTDMVSAYKMSVPYHTHTDWLAIASYYAHALITTQRQPDPVPLRTQALLHHAFLAGVQIGASHAFRLSRLNDAKEVQALRRKARLVGLEDPGRMVMGEAEGVKIAVGMEGRRLGRVLEGAGGSGRQMLLEGGVGGVEEEDDDDGEGTVFELGDDGLMV